MGRTWAMCVATRARLRLLHGIVYGTKDELWERLLEFGKVARKEAALQRELAGAREASRGGLSEQERLVLVLPAPKPQSGAEIDAHESTHFFSKPWCQFCQMGWRRTVPLGYQRLIFPHAILVS